MILFPRGRRYVLAQRTKSQIAESALAREHLHMDVVQVRVRPRLFGPFFGVMNKLFGRLNPADSPKAGQYPHPVGDHYEQKDGHHQREEPPCAFPPRYALRQIQEELDEYLYQVLHPARNFAHAPRGEIRYDQQRRDSQPRGNHRVRELKARKEFVGDNRLGGYLNVRQRRAQKPEPECVAQRPAQQTRHKRDNPYQRYRRNLRIAKQSGHYPLPLFPDYPR